MRIYEETKNNRQRYVLDRRLAGRRLRNYFPTRRKAEKAMADQEKELKKFGDMYARYSETERIEMVLAHEEALSGDFKLIDAVRYYADKENGSAEDQVTLGQAAREFLRSKKKQIRPRSYSSLESTLERFDYWNAALASVKKSDISSWLEAGKRRDGTPWSSKTKNNCLTDLKNFFNWCVFEDYIEASPAVHIRRFRATDAELAASEESKHILTVSEARSIMNHLQRRHPDMVARAALLLFAGRRPEREAAGVTWDDIDLQSRLVHVRASRAKDRQNRYIEMPDNLVKWLSNYRRNPDGCMGGISVKAWEKRWFSAREQLGLTGDNWPHDATRHSFASYHLALNGEEATKNALGHGSYDMLFQHYRTLVKKADGEEYFQIFPACC